MSAHACIGRWLQKHQSCILLLLLSQHWLYRPNLSSSPWWKPLYFYMQFARLFYKMGVCACCENPFNKEASTISRVLYIFYVHCDINGICMCINYQELYCECWRTIFLCIGTVIPHVITSHQGAEFNNKLDTNIMALLAIRHHLTAPYHPQVFWSVDSTYINLILILILTGKWFRLTFQPNASKYVGKICKLYERDVEHLLWIMYNIMSRIN